MRLGRGLDDLGHTDLVVDLAQTEKFIAFSLDQLKAENRHHEFEWISFRCAKARISSNVRIATGPVSAGGDQGRDGETFTTDLLRESPRGPGDNWFAESASTEPWVMACTLQDGNLRAKVLEDLQAITAEGSGLVSRVVYFSLNDIPAGQRHQLERVARETYGVELLLFTKADMQVWLAEADLVWVAQRHLGLPDVLIPDTPAHGSPEWYTEDKRLYTDQDGPLNATGYERIRRALRYATHNRKQDIETWLHLTRQFVNSSGEALTEVGVKAEYEIAVATIRGLDSTDGVEAHVDDVFRFAIESQSVDMVEQAAVLLTYWITAARIHLRGYDFERVRERSGTLRAHVEDLLDSTDPATHPVRQGLLISLLAFVCLQPSPALYQTGEPRRDEEEPRQPSAWFTDVRAGMRYLVQLVDLLPDVPVIPIEHTHDLFDMLAEALVEQPEYARVRSGLDDAIAARSGDSTAAAACRDRGMKFFQAGRYVEAVFEFHDAKRRWLNGDSLEGAILAMEMLGHCYELLGLPLASKQYWMAAATFANTIASLRPHVLRAFEQVTNGAYLMGMWLDAAGLTRATLVARAAFSGPNERDPNEPDPLDVIAVMSHLAAERFWPHAKDNLLQALGDSGWATDLPDVAAAAGKNLAWTEAEFSALVADQLKGAPFADAGPTRIYRFSAFGQLWQISARNSRADVLAAERFGAALQVLLADIGRTIPYLLGVSVDVLVTTEPPLEGARHVFPAVLNGSLHLRVHLREFEGRPTEVEGELFAVLVDVIGLISDPASFPDLKAMIDLVGQALPKLFTAGPYDEIATALPDEHYAACASLLPVTASVIPMLTSNAELNPADTPAPLYNRAASKERIRTSYENLMSKLRATLPVLQLDQAYSTLVALFRGEGWLDWQILQATANVAVTARAGIRAGDLADPASVQARMREAMRAEEGGEPPLAPAIFTEDALREGLDTGVLVVAQNWWNLRPSNPILVAAYRDLLARRFRFFADDTPHPALCGPKGTGTGE